MHSTKEQGMDQQDALLSEAFISGRRAGLWALSPSLNPHPPGTAEHLQWQQGHQSGQSAVNDYANQKARKEWWEGHSEFDRDATSGAYLRTGT